MENASKEVIQCLQKLFQSEMAGIIRYQHYSFMIMGYSRIPIQKWFRDQATESMAHAVEIGEKITSLGGHPTMMPFAVEETNQHSIQALLQEALRHEEDALAQYGQLVRLAGNDIALEELARSMLRQEQEHIDEVKKMLRSP